MEGDMMKTKHELEIEGTKKGHTYKQWIFAIIANCPLLTYGLQAGWISPTTRALQSQSSPLGAPISDNTMGVVASLMPISALVAVPIFTFIADRYGRKVAILLVSVPHLASWLLKLISPCTTTLMIARICCGIAAGGCFNAIPMYTKEISQDDIRGRLGSLLILFHNLGIFLMYIIGAYLDYYTVLYVVVGFPVLSFILMLKCPESPGYLVKTGKYDQAVQVIASLRGLDVDDKSIHTEVDAMKKEEEYYKTLPSLSLIVILKDRAWRKAFVLVLLLVSVQTFSGNFAVVTYGSTILAASGAQLNAELQSISFPGIMMIGSIVSIAVVEKIGRRVILGCSCLITACAQVCLATVLLLIHQGYSAPGWLPMLSIVLSMFAYAFGLLPIPYIVMTEVFNIQIRAKLICIIVAHTWGMTFAQLATFAPITTAFGMHSMFFFFASVNLFGLFVALVLMPETRGKTVEHIETVLRDNKYPI